jgi:predicted aspartyl protease
MRAVLALALAAGLSTAALSTAAWADDQPGQIVAVEPKYGAFVVPVVLNDVLTAKFIVDSGAADVSMASVRIGGMVMEDVTVRIATANSSLLLGQSFLRRLKSWSMDNARQVMIIN